MRRKNDAVFGKNDCFLQGADQSNLHPGSNNIIYRFSFFDRKRILAVNCFSSSE